MCCLRIASVVLIAVQVVACAEVRVVGGSDTQVKSCYGIVNVDVNVKTGTKLVAVQTRGIGLIGGQLHFTAGWMSESSVVVPDPSTCAAVIIAESSEHVAGIEKMLGDTGKSLDTICVVNRGEE